jgi:hypothetical protein
LACFCVHFFFILAVSCRETLALLAVGYASLPVTWQKYWQKAEDIVIQAMGGDLALSNPLRQGLTAYQHGAGIEAGYGFFAPSVPNSYKLVFEVHFSDGRVEYELPSVGNDAAGLRLSSLLDYIGSVHYDPLREVMLKMLAYSVWQKHPEAIAIRAVFGYVDVPGPSEAAQGKSESYHFLYAYDFSFHPSSTESLTPR